MKEKKREAVYNPEADKKWRQKNPERNRYLTYRRTARMFIRDHAEESDLDELREMIEERLKGLA